MPVRTTLNRPYIRDVVWQLKTNKRGLNERAGFSGSYIYELVPDDDNAPHIDVSLSTIDKLHNAIEGFMIDLGINPPDDLWDKLVIHREVDEI